MGLLRVRSKFAMGLIGFNSWGLLNAQRCLADRPFILPFISPLPHFIFLIPMWRHLVIFQQRFENLLLISRSAFYVRSGSVWGQLLNGYFLSYKTAAVVEKSMHHTDNGFENALCINEFHWIMSSVSHNYHYTYRTPYRN